MQTDSRTDSRRLAAILFLTASVAFASAPIWSSGFGGFDPNRYPIPQVSPPVQPAGYAFSIWGVIYVWLIVSAGYGLLLKSDDPAWDRARWPLIASLVVGTPWISVAQVSPVWATAMIWVMLVTALVGLARTPAERPWLYRAPVALYTGWLTAASLVATALLGAGYGVALGETGWAWAALLVALAVAVAVLRALPPAPMYGVGVAWALAAVAVRNWGENPGLVGLAVAGAAAVLWLAGVAWRRRVAEG